MSVDITVNETVNDVEIVVQPNVIEVNVTRTSGGGGGAVNSVNGQTGTVVLNADNIAETATRGWLTSTLKTAYDSAVTWISTNGTNLLNHLSNTSNPHSTTATQVDALKRDGSNANSDVDLGTFSLNAKAVKVNGTGGAGNVGLKHQSTNATASTSETAIFAGSDGELYYKNDGNAVAQIASRAWVVAQGFVTDVIASLGFTPANIANTNRVLKSIFTGNAVTTTETVVGTCQVGGIGLGSSFSLRCFLRSQKSNTTSQGNLKFYLNTTPDLSGSPVQIAVNASSSALVIPLERTFTYSGGNLYGWNATNNAPTDVSNSTVAETVTTVDMSTIRYLIATLQTTGTAGSTLNGRDFKVIVEPNVV